MKTLFIENIALRNKKRLISEKQKLYNQVKNGKEIYSYQLQRFNNMWRYAAQTNPFYTIWKRKYSLPDSIASLGELKNFPVLKKKHVQEKQELIFSHLKHYHIISTGGSTGEPTQFPISKDTMRNHYANAYIARGWWGISPLDNILLLWGHSHLFGSGLRGRINQCKRVLTDWLINTKRLNAYDMSLNTIDKYYKIFKTSNPKVLIGYVSSIRYLAQYMNDNTLDLFEQSNLAGVIVTSEIVTESDINLMEKAFKVPIIIEYGMAETGVVAYSKGNSNNIEILWDTFVAMSDEDNVLRLTTLDNRLFPLINYDTGDLIDVNNAEQSSVLSLKRIIGRSHDILQIKLLDGRSINIHGELFTHIMKTIPDIFSFKITQKRNKKITVQIVSALKSDMHLNAIGKIFIKEFSKEFSNVDKEQFDFEAVNHINKSVAGKEKWIEIES